MEQLHLKPRPAIDEIVENWDDDDIMVADDEALTFWNQSGPSATRSTSNRRRDSLCSFLSDLESLPGDERQVLLPGDDEKSTLDAIAAAAHAGIPIPINVPPSALVGGAIKRLGGRKMKKISQEDWGDELELPAPGQALRLKTQDGKIFPDALRRVSGPQSPTLTKKPLPALAQISPPRIGQRGSLGAPINLEKFRDTDDDDDMFGDSTSTIKASKFQARGRPISLMRAPTPSQMKRRSKDMEEDDFENDLELPSDGKLKLSSKRDIPKASLHIPDDFDWGEGSLGTRFGGTRRDGFSTWSSSVSAMSPSIASSFTAESEDEFFDGLVLPFGPLDLGERLKRRKQSPSPNGLGILNSQQESRRPISPRHILPQLASPTRYSFSHLPTKAVSPRRDPANRALQANIEEEDLVSGLDLGEGNVFRFAKTTLHRNVKVKEARPASPVRPKAAVSITFTSNLKPINPPVSRIPRPMVSHERSHTQSSLEPVSESGGPIPPKPPRRPGSRLSSHSAHSSVSSIHTPTTPSSTQSSYSPTPRRKELGQKTSTGVLRAVPTTTNAQLLRLKRSLPAMRHAQPPAKHIAGRSERPPSRGDSRADAYRSQSSLRPKTPVERVRPTYESSVAQARKGQAPFLPAGASQSQSHHVNSRVNRSFKRQDSEQGSDSRPFSRTQSRNGIRSPSPKRPRGEKSTSEPVWQQISKPRRVRHFGDGHELDTFDDLPTSAQTESRYTKQPITSGNKVNIRNKLYQNVLPDRKTPSPISAGRIDTLPRFARDTAASRIARETSLAQRAQPMGPLAPLPSHRVVQLSSRPNFTPYVSLNHTRFKKSRKPPQLKPHLISNLSSAKDSKVINGMTYNPSTFRWEGNENALNAFEVPTSSPSVTPLPQPLGRDRENSTPRPVLITNINTKKEIKREGDMVFDPQNMCWIEIKTSTPNGSQPDDPMAGFSALEQDDPFRDIPDLEDKTSSATGAGGANDIREDWLVGEEFDVGPEFVRRQRDEEARWRRKCEKWSDGVSRNQTDWRWAIRDIVMQNT